MVRELRDIKPPTELTRCMDKDNGNCPYLVFNEYDVPCCGINGDVGVEWWYCVPSETLQKEKEKSK